MNPLLTKENSNDVTALRQALGATANIMRCLVADLQKQNGLLAALHLELAEAKGESRKFSSHLLEMQDDNLAREVLEALGQPQK